MTNDATDLLLAEILMKPSNEMKSTEKETAASCTAKCDAGMCRTFV